MIKMYIIFIPLPVLEISYKSLASKTNETLISIADFLQVESKSVVFESPLKKVNPGSCKEKIVNYDQVAETLKNSKYAHLLKS